MLLPLSGFAFRKRALYVTRKLLDRLTRNLHDGFDQTLNSDQRRTEWQRYFLANRGVQLDEEQPHRSLSIRCDVILNAPQLRRSRVSIREPRGHRAVHA